ncbi:hypothetical protein CHELA40_14272 [Chelatococcus asaccharovorans]|nr:hypothetical protein CHELA17_61348 [Chelatococcus asaccharovorans]CAH1676374.1 hypothetical protein CHELA40_14272 [Chelatococcus asaccharovorans]
MGTESEGWPSYHEQDGRLNEICHAIGVMVVNYSSLEFEFDSLFSTYLWLRPDVGTILSTNMETVRKTAALRAVITAVEVDTDVADGMMRAIAAFDIIRESRNKIIHHQMTFYSHTEEETKFAPGAVKVDARNGKLRIRSFDFSLENLRTFADTVKSLSNHLNRWRAYLYMRNLPPSSGDTLPLPDKFPLPDEIHLQQ